MSEDRAARPHEKAWVVEEEEPARRSQWDRRETRHRAKEPRGQTVSGTKAWPAMSSAAGRWTEDWPPALGPLGLGDLDRSRFYG